MTQTKEITPGKLLEQISPVPRLTAVQNVRKRGQNVAIILTSEENITRKKQKLNTSRQKQELVEKRPEILIIGRKYKI